MPTIVLPTRTSVTRLVDRPRVSDSGLRTLSLACSCLATATMLSNPADQFILLLLLSWFSLTIATAPSNPMVEASVMGELASAISSHMWSSVAETQASFALGVEGLWGT